MPDLARSTAEMLEEMKKTLEQPEGNTSCAKHRQNVALAITTLIKEQITDAPFRQLYIDDAGGKKGATKSAPLLLQLSFRLCLSRRCGSIARVNTRNGVGVRVLERL